MFPLKDENPHSRFPILTVFLIVINAAVFVGTLLTGTFEEVIDIYGMKPVEIFAGRRLFILFTLMFLHGGILHIFGNMLYLYIFGDNVEDALGRGGFLAFYLFAGLASSFAQAITDPTSAVPSIGASGAISGVLGAYIVLYPRARVLTFVGVFFFWAVKVPAILFIGFWFVLQLLSASVTWMAGVASEVAYWAHIGGFIVGVLIALPLRDRLLRRRSNAR